MLNLVALLCVLGWEAPSDGSAVLFRSRFTEEDALAAWRCSEKGVARAKAPEPAGQALQLDALTTNATAEVRRTFLPPLTKVTVVFEFYDDLSPRQCFGLYLDQDGTWTAMVGLGVNTQYAPDHYVARLGMPTKPTEIRRTKGWHWGLIAVEEQGVKMSLDGVPCAEGKDLSRFNTLILENAFSPIFASTAFVSEVVVIDHDRWATAGVGLLRPQSYGYSRPPDQGDEKATVLTDGDLSQTAAHWGWYTGQQIQVTFQFPEEVLLTGGEVFLSPESARTVSRIAIETSRNGEDWRPAVEQEKAASRRPKAAGLPALPVAYRLWPGVGKWVRLTFHRSKVDQSLDVLEVRFSGRKAERFDPLLLKPQVPYDLGPKLPPTTEARYEDEHYWYLSSPAARFAIHKPTGLIAGGWLVCSQPRSGRGVASETALPAVASLTATGDKLIERAPDRYYWETRNETRRVDEYSDVVRPSALGPRPSALSPLTLTCTNPAIDGLVLHKSYHLSQDGRSLIKTLTVSSTSPAQPVDQAAFLTVASSMVLEESFRSGGYYLGGDYFGPLVPAGGITTRQRLPQANHWMMLENPSVPPLAKGRPGGVTVASFRLKVDGHFLLPWGEDLWTEEGHKLYHTRTGWEFGLFTTRLDGLEGRSAETWYSLLPGTREDFHRYYTDLPEVKSFYRQERPAWVDQVRFTLFSGGRRDPTGLARRFLEQYEEGYLMQVLDCFVWGDYVPEGRWRLSQEVVAAAPPEEITSDWIKATVKALHALSPRIKVGPYTWRWSVLERSQLFRQHPDWFITKTKEGQPRLCYAGLPPNFATLLSAPDCADHLLKQYDDLLRAYGFDFIYLDGGAQSVAWIDWEKSRVDQDTHWQDFHQGIHEVARKHGSDKAVFFNNAYTPIADCGFRELGNIGQDVQQNWREHADKMYTVKLFQLDDPTRWVSPLYWSGPLPSVFYANYILGLGLRPTYNEFDLTQYFTASYEVRHLQIVREARVEPRWPLDGGDLEVFAVRQGQASFFSLVNHAGATKRFTFSADRQAMGIDPRRPVFLWKFTLSDPNRFVYQQEGPGQKIGYALPWNENREAAIREAYQQSGWRLCNVLTPEYLGEKTFPGGRVELEMDLLPNVLQMVMLTHSPAVVFAVNGRPTQFWLPTMLGVEVEGRLSSREATLTVRCEAQSAEVLVPLPESWVRSEPRSESGVASETAPACLTTNLDGRSVPGRIILLGGQRMVLVSVPAGEHRLRLQSRASLHRRPAKVHRVSLPTETTAGSQWELLVELEFPRPLQAEAPGTLTGVVAGRVALVRAVTLQPNSKDADQAVLRVSCLVPEKAEPGNYEMALCLEGVGLEREGKLGTISIVP